MAQNTTPKITNRTPVTGVYVDSNDVVHDFNEALTGGEIAVRYADTADKDAFGALRVSEKVTVQDSQNVVDFDTEFFYNAVIYDSATPEIAEESSNASVTGVNGSFIGPLDTDKRMVPIELDSSYASGQAIVQMKEYATYTPAKSQLMWQTGIFSPNINKPNQTVSMVLRTSCSGATEDIPFTQSSWNKDTLDGSGDANNPSGLEIDFNNIQIFYIDAQMLYAGRMRFGFDIGGVIIEANDSYIANLQDLPTLQNYNLPLRRENINVSGRACSRIGLFDKYNGLFLSVEDDFLAGKAKTWIKCQAVQSEGGADLGGIPALDIRTSSQTIGTTLTPIISFRPEATFNGLPNNGLLYPLDFSAINQGNSDCMLVLVHGATITGGSWVNTSDSDLVNHHTFKVNKTATGMTGGHWIDATPLPKAGGSKTVASQQKISTVRVPVLFSRVDDLEILAETLTLAAIVNSGTTTVGMSKIRVEEIRQ